MGRSRSRSPHRSKDSRRRSRSHSRDRSRRDRGRDDEYSRRQRDRSGSRERRSRRRSRSHSPDARQHAQKRERSSERPAPPLLSSTDGQDEKRRRLEAWKAKQGLGSAPSSTDPVAYSSSREANDAGHSRSTPAAAVDEYEQFMAGLAHAAPPLPIHIPIPDDIAAKKAKAAQQEVQELLDARRNVDEVDPLDAFMSNEVLPEVKQRQGEEAARREEERRKIADALAKGKAPKVLEESDEEEEVANREIEIPANKIKLMVGAGGEKIKEIQKKSKTRIQIKKDESELNVGFGEMPKIKVPKPGEVRMATVQLFGDDKHVEIALRMIQEAVDNKEQKEKQRQKEYERKREDKRQARMLYHLRHTKDYEALGVPLGTSKADVKAAYKKLVLKWHPDKHPEDPETAKAKFQAIQKAYDSLMTTDEEEVQLPIAN